MGKSSALEVRVAQLEEAVESLQFQLALAQGFDVVRRFRHHVMYDLVKAHPIDLPPRMNTKKRTNFPVLLEAIKNAGDLVPQQWQNALKGLEALDKIYKFPCGFWDHTDNAAVTPESMQDFLNKIPDEVLREQVSDMCKCSLLCTPPCARGNNNTPNKSSFVPPPTETSKAPVQAPVATTKKKASKKAPKREQRAATQPEKAVKKTSSKKSGDTGAA